MPVERRAWGSGELGRRYLIAAVLAVPAGVAGALVTVALLRATHALSDRSPGSGGGSWSCPDGVSCAVPGLVGADVGALVGRGLALALRTCAGRVRRSHTARTGNSAHSE
ncbi:hypothetical protein GCM10027174_43530 [Salinifilum aidingensis]